MRRKLQVFCMGGPVRTYTECQTEFSRRSAAKLGWAKEREYIVDRDKDFTHIIDRPWHFDLKIGFKRPDLTLTKKLCSSSLHTLYQKAHCAWSTSQIGPREENKWSWQGSALTILTVGLETCFKVPAQSLPLPKGILCWNMYIHVLGPEERKYAPGRLITVSLIIRQCD